MNLTDIDNFPETIIKRARLILNLKFCLHNLKQCICTIAIKNGCNTHTVQVLSEECDGIFYFYVNPILDYQILLNSHTSGDWKF